MRTFPHQLGFDIPGIRESGIVGCHTKIAYKKMSSEASHASLQEQRPYYTMSRRCVIRSEVYPRVSIKHMGAEHDRIDQKCMSMLRTLAYSNSSACEFIHMLFKWLGAPPDLANQNFGIFSFNREEKDVYV